MNALVAAIAVFLPVAVVYATPVSKSDKNLEVLGWSVIVGNMTPTSATTLATPLIIIGNWTRTFAANGTTTLAPTSTQPPSAEDVWRVKLGDICQITRFPVPSGESTRFVECVKPTNDEEKWPWGDKGIWVLRQCPPGSEYHLISQMCRSRRYIRRQQSICATNPTAQFCPQPQQQQYSVQQQQQMTCQCPPGINVCACPQPTVIQPQPQQISCPPINCPLPPCPQPQVQQYCPMPPQPCPLATQGATGAKEGDLCSWMLAPLAADPNNNKCFLQCAPAPGNPYCGRWVRMPCAPGTIFDVNVQVCVHDPFNVPGPVAPYSAANQACNVGTSIGACNTNFQCPGQSVCQVQQATPQCQVAPQSCTTCCYTGAVGAAGGAIGGGFQLGKK